MSKKKGHLFIISAPAGTGKTTLVNMLTQEFPQVVRGISCTTRQPRPGEVQGRDYFFVTEEEFEQKLQAGDFLEHANVFGCNYGTSRSRVEKELKRGKIVILVIDTQGALQIQKQLKGKIDVTFIFISPPSLEEIKKRLERRGTESPDVLEKRVAWARHELEMISYYDYHIVNDKIADAYQKLKDIVMAADNP